MMEDLSLHILDMAENAIAAGSSRIMIAVNENEARDILTIRVADNGRGMSRAERERSLDPFFTTKRKRTGLGLPLLAQTAGLCGGTVSVESTPGKGTKVVAGFRCGHIDRPPLTRMAETMMMLVFGHPEIDFRYQHRRNGRVFSFGSREFFGRSGPGPVWSAERIAAARETLQAGLAKIGAR